MLGGVIYLGGRTSGCTEFVFLARYLIGDTFPMVWTMSFRG